MFLFCSFREKKEEMNKRIEEFELSKQKLNLTMREFYEKYDNVIYKFESKKMSHILDKLRLIESDLLSIDSSILFLNRIKMEPLIHETSLKIMKDDNSFSNPIYFNSYVEEKIKEIEKIINGKYTIFI